MFGHSYAFFIIIIIIIIILLYNRIIVQSSKLWSYNIGSIEIMRWPKLVSTQAYKTNFKLTCILTF